MRSTFIYHKKEEEEDAERARMEQDYQLATAQRKPRSGLVYLSNRWNRLVEAIAAAVSFSAHRDRTADQEKEEE